MRYCGNDLETACYDKVPCIDCGTKCWDASLCGKNCFCGDDPTGFPRSSGCYPDPDSKTPCYVCTAPGLCSPPTPPSYCGSTLENACNSKAACDASCYSNRGFCFSSSRCSSISPTPLPLYKCGDNGYCVQNPSGIPFDMCQKGCGTGPTPPPTPPPPLQYCGADLLNACYHKHPCDDCDSKCFDASLCGKNCYCGDDPTGFPRSSRCYPDPDSKIPCYVCTGGICNHTPPPSYCGSTLENACNSKAACDDSCYSNGGLCFSSSRCSSIPLTPSSYNNL